LAGPKGKSLPVICNDKGKSIQGPRFTALLESIIHYRHACAGFLFAVAGLFYQVLEFSLI
jgi:hypothetical protein